MNGHHFVVLLYFLFGVAFTDFQAPNNTASYTDRVDSGIKILVFLSSLVGLPVGFLLGRPIPPATAPAPFASGAGKQPPAPVE